MQSGGNYAFDKTHVVTRVSDSYCGAHMYADDLALITNSPPSSHAEPIVSSYARKW